MLAENIIPLILAIFAMGGVSTMISLDGIAISELQEKVEELEKHKASKIDLQGLSDRVRRKLDGQLKENSNKLHYLDIKYCVLERDVNQNSEGLDSYWKNFNRIFCK